MICRLPIAVSPQNTQFSVFTAAPCRRPLAQDAPFDPELERVRGVTIEILELLLAPVPRRRRWTVYPAAEELTSYGVDGPLRFDQVVG